MRALILAMILAGCASSKPERVLKLEGSTSGHAVKAQTDGELSAGTTGTTLPSYVFTGASATGLTIDSGNVMEFKTGDSAEIARCNKTTENGKPYDCHFVGKHTLDNLIDVFWTEKQDRAEFYREQAEALKKHLKP